MGLGPNMVLDKAFQLPAVSQLHKRGEILIQTAVNAGGQSAARAVAGTNVTVATNILPYVVLMEDVDAVRALTGKVDVNCRMLGIARVLAGAAITQGARIVPDATARGVVSARTAGGTAPIVVAGIALNAQATVGAEFDMLVTIGLTW